MIFWSLFAFLVIVFNALTIQTITCSKKVDWDPAAIIYDDDTSSKDVGGKESSYYDSMGKLRPKINKNNVPFINGKAIPPNEIKIRGHRRRRSTAIFPIQPKEKRSLIFKESKNDQLSNFDSLIILSKRHKGIDRSHYTPHSFGNSTERIFFRTPARNRNSSSFLVLQPQNQKSSISNVERSSSVLRRSNDDNLYLFNRFIKRGDPPEKITSQANTEDSGVPFAPASFRNKHRKFDKVGSNKGIILSSKNIFSGIFSDAPPSLIKYLKEFNEKQIQTANPISSPSNSPKKERLNQIHAHAQTSNNEDKSIHIPTSPKKIRFTSP